MIVFVRTFLNATLDHLDQVSALGLAIQRIPVPSLDARQEGDVVTSDLLVALALDYFDEADRLASRWLKIEAHLDDHGALRSTGRESPPAA